jgi:hypothetical protein
MMTTTMTDQQQARLNQTLDAYTNTNRQLRQQIQSRNGGGPGVVGTRKKVSVGGGGNIYTQMQATMTLISGAN